MRYLLVLSLVIATLIFASTADAQTHVRWTAMGHDSPLSGMEYAPNGQYFVTCALTDPHVIVWDGVTGKYLFHFDVPGDATSLAIAPDSKTIVVGGATALVIYDFVARTQTRLVDSLTQNVDALKFSPSGDSLAWVSSDGTGTFTCLMNMHTSSRSFFRSSSKLNMIENNWLRNSGRTAVFSHDLRYVAMYNDTAINIYSLASRSLLSTIPHIPWRPESTTDFVAFFHGGDSLLTLSDIETSTKIAAAIVDVQMGRVTRTIPNVFPTALEQISWLGEDTIVRVLPTGMQVIPISSWDTTNTLPIPARGNFIYQQTSIGARVAFSPDRKFTLVTDPLWFTGIPEDDFYGYPAQIVRFPTGDTTRALTINGVDHVVASVAFSPNGSGIATGSNALSVLTRDGVVTHYEPTPIGSLDYNPDGTLLACTEYEYGTNGHGYTEILNSKTFASLHHSYGKVGYMLGEPYSQLHFSPTDSAVAIGSVIYDFDTSTQVPYDIWPEERFLNCYSSDGKRLYVPYDGKYYVIDPYARKFIDSGWVRSPTVSSIVLSSNDSLLYIGGGDGKIEIVTAKDDGRVAWFTINNGSVSDMRLSHDGRYLIIAGSDSTIKILNTSTLTLVGTIHGFEGYTGVAISPDSKDILGITRNAIIDYDSLPAGLAVPVKEQATESVTLEQNYPNPVVASATINFSVPHEVHATLRLFDELGRTVATLIDANLSTGAHRATLDRSQLHLRQGVYYYELTTPIGRESRMLQIW